MRATSTNLFGPYQFQEVVLQKRPDQWDNSRVHNVKIVKAGDKYVIFYINSANETGYAVSDSITGPWTRTDAPVIHASNPAPLVRADVSTADDFEMVSNGPLHFGKPQSQYKTLVLREKKPWKGTNGRWNRAYVFLDGHAAARHHDRHGERGDAVEQLVDDRRVAGEPGGVDDAAQPARVGLGALGMALDAGGAEIAVELAARQA